MVLNGYRELDAVARILGVTEERVREQWSCFYPDGPAGERKLWRDMAEVRKRGLA